MDEVVIIDKVMICFLFNMLLSYLIALFLFNDEYILPNIPKS